MWLFDVRVPLHHQDFITQSSWAWGSSAWKASLRAKNPPRFPFISTETLFLFFLSESLTGNRATFSLDWEFTIIFIFIIIIATVNAASDRDRLGRTSRHLVTWFTLHQTFNERHQTLIKLSVIFLCSWKQSKKRYFWFFSFLPTNRKRWFIWSEFLSFTHDVVWGKWIKPRLRRRDVTATRQKRRLTG